MKLKELARMIGGEIVGDPEIEVRGAAGISEAKEGEITFLSDMKLAGKCAGSKASGVIVRDFVPEMGKTQLVVKNPLFAFVKVLELFSEPAQHAGISNDAFVSEKAKIGKGVSIYAFAFISDNAVIGDGTIIHPGVFIGHNTVVGSQCILYPNVTVRERVTLGNRVIVHSGSVIGSDGFGYVLEEGKHHKIPQVGGVIVGDDVEIGACVSIDRATTGNTLIGGGTKIDNLVQIAHNVRIGENTILAGQVGIAGSSEIGNFVVMGGQVGVADHSRVDDGAMVGAQSGIFGHLKKGVYSGAPAMPHRDWLKASALFARLPELNKKIRELEEKIKTLERRYS
ncbi:MAG TPA: UDP-3-O-(3-hydroxymyristoyl)glucosamine N-acyltransferase [Thermodesulfovibrionales bacterium]|nr:UDP-3-O-(3-hydroxymyristoyl)glucosamine N-acyltransferase [Thermodesulfovibrionales bacterium]